MTKNGSGNRQGFTYTEVVFSLPIVLISALTAISIILSALQFHEMAKAYTQALNFGQYQMEQIRNYASLDANTFRTTMLGLNGKRFPTYGIDIPAESNALRGFGVAPFRIETVSYVSMLPSDSYSLANVTVVVCFMDTNERVFGEDKNLNGTLDAGEDKNGNGVIDSPITLHSLVERK